MRSARVEFDPLQVGDDVCGLFPARQAGKLLLGFLDLNMLCFLKCSLDVNPPHMHVVLTRLKGLRLCFSLPIVCTGKLDKELEKGA